MKLPLLASLFAALIIALAAPQPMALAAAGFEIPTVFVAALVGLVSTFIVQALKDKFPAEIVDKFAILVSAIVVGALNFIAGTITINVPEGAWPIPTQIFLYLASLLTSWATYKLLFKREELIVLEAHFDEAEG